MSAFHLKLFFPLGCTRIKQYVILVSSSWPRYLTGSHRCFGEAGHGRPKRRLNPQGAVPALARSPASAALPHEGGSHPPRPQSRGETASLPLRAPKGVLRWCCSFRSFTRSPPLPQVTGGYCSTRALSSVEKIASFLDKVVCHSMEHTSNTTVRKLTGPRYRRVLPLSGRQVWVRSCRKGLAAEQAPGAPRPWGVCPCLGLQEKPACRGETPSRAPPSEVLRRHRVCWREEVTGVSPRGRMKSGRCEQPQIFNVRLLPPVLLGSLAFSWDRLSSNRQNNPAWTHG